MPRQPPRGEVVIIVGPPADAPPVAAATLDDALRAAMQDASLSAAASEVAALLKLPRKSVYARALELRDAE